MVVAAWGGPINLAISDPPITDTSNTLNRGVTDPLIHPTNNQIANSTVTYDAPDQTESDKSLVIV